jgi:hypothetical protein
MNNPTNEMVFGKATYGRTGGHGWGYIEDNKDNVYRVLPPVKSLMAKGQYAKYYRTHRGFRGTDGKQKPFQCIEEFNFKQKLITKHCPICDIVADLEAEVKTFPSKGATAEQIRDYRNKNIFPFQAEGKYYLNVVNQENKIMVLGIGSKMFKSLEMLAQEQEKKGRDICGLEGLFLNFKKQSAYKGDNKAVHSVGLYVLETATGPQYVPHVIDATFAARVPTEAADLGNLFKILNVEQIAQIIQLQGDDRAKYMDVLFAGEPATPAEASSPASQPASQGFTPPAGFGATTPQGTPTMAAAPAPTAAPAAFAPPAGFSAPVQAPAQAAAPAPAAAPAGFTAPVGFGGGQAVAPAAASTFTPPAGFGGTGPAPAAAPGQPTAQLNDQDFLNMVRPKK